MSTLGLPQTGSPQTEDVLGLCRQRLALMERFFEKGSKLSLIVNGPSGDVGESVLITNEPSLENITRVVEYMRTRQ